MPNGKCATVAVLFVVWEGSLIKNGEAISGKPTIESSEYRVMSPKKPKVTTSGPSAGESDNGPPASSWQDEMMTTRELMEFLNLSRTKIWELVTKQGLPAFKIGGDYRYRRSEVLTWMEKYRVGNS